MTNKFDRIHTNTNKKYIIRNCPCFIEGIAIKGNEQKTQTCNNHKLRELTLCQVCTDCVIRQIVELCKKDLKPVREWQEGDAVFVEYKKDVHLANNILQLLQIEVLDET